MNKKLGFWISTTLISSLILSSCAKTSDLLESSTSPPIDGLEETKPADNIKTKEPTSPPIDGVDEPTDDQVTISSYPPGAEVYIVPATVDIYDLKLDDVVNPSNLFGTTPLTDDLSTGNYFVIVVFSPDLFTDFGYNLPSRSDATFDGAFPFDGNPSQSMTFSEGEYIDSFTKIYRLYKDAGRSESLISIALPLPENQRGQQKPVIYPTLATVESLSASYSFKTTTVEQAIEDSLKDYNLTSSVDPAMVSEMVEVLLRVGKVKLDTSDVDFIVHMHGTGSSSFSITTYGG